MLLAQLDQENLFELYQMGGKREKLGSIP